MKSLHLGLFLLILTISIQACSGVPGKGTSTPDPNQPLILFSDDFSATDNHWDQVSETDRVTDYYNNTYRIMINKTNNDAWANPSNQSFADTHIEVDATKKDGPDDNDFGVICRYKDVNSFYYGVVSSDGYYGILKMASGSGKTLGYESMQQNKNIVQGTGTNHIRFDCVGSTLTLSVNGFILDQQTDTDYTTGNVGLIAGTFSTKGADVLFDNFVVYKP